MKLSSLASVEAGRLKTTTDPKSTYALQIEELSSADFTIETGFQINSVIGSCCPLLAHWGNEDNRLSLNVRADLHVEFKVALDSSVFQLVSSKPASLNADYKLVIERVGHIVSMYLNSKLVAFGSLVGPLPFSDLVLSGHHLNEVAHGARQLWAIRVANTSLYKGNVAQVRRYGTFEGQELVSDVWRQFRFEKGSLFDEVTGSEMRLYGNATINEFEKLHVATAGIANYAEFDHVAFEDNEDFYIRCTFANDNPASTVRNQTILGQWSTSAGISSWLVTQQGPASSDVANRNFIGLNYKDSDNVVHNVYSASAISYNAEHLLEVVRKDGFITIYVDGIAGPSKYVPKGNPKSNYAGTRLFRFDSTQASEQGSGRRDDIQIIKGPFRFRPGNKPALPAYERPVYDQETADKIVLQLGFRRGSRMCEVNDTLLQLNGTAFVGKNARLAQGNSGTSFASIPVPYFGAADFTIEFMLNVSAIGQYGLNIGHWDAASTDSVNNRWHFTITSDMKPRFAMGRSNLGTDREILTGERAISLRTDTHVVIERFNGILAMYVDGNAVTARAYSGAMLGGPSVFRTISFNNAATFAGSLWNIRIADAALYKEVDEVPWFVGKTLAFDGESIARGGYSLVPMTVANVTPVTGGAQFSRNPVSSIDIPAQSMQPLDKDWEIFVDVTPHDPGYQVLFNLGGGLNVAWSSLILILRENGKVRFGGTYANTQYDFGSDDSAAGDCGDWTPGERITVQAKRTGNSVEVYVNGILTRTFAVTKALANSGTRPLRIGRVLHNPGMVVGIASAMTIHKFYYNIL